MAVVAIMQARHKKYPALARPEAAPSSSRSRFRAFLAITKPVIEHGRLKMGTITVSNAPIPRPSDKPLPGAENSGRELALN